MFFVRSARLVAATAKSYQVSSSLLPPLGACSHQVCRWEEVVGIRLVTMVWYINLMFCARSPCPHALVNARVLCSRFPSLAALYTGYIPGVYFRPGEVKYINCIQSVSVPSRHCACVCVCLLFSSSSYLPCLLVSYLVSLFVLTTLTIYKQKHIRLVPGTTVSCSLPLSSHSCTCAPCTRASLVAPLRVWYLVRIVVLTRFV